MPTSFKNVIIIKEAVHPDLATFLEARFLGYHIAVLKEPKNADYTLVLEKEHIEQNITSVSASTSPRQYQIYYAVTYSLIAKKAPPIIASHTLILTRQVTINNDRILGSDYEESLILKEMRNDAAMQIMMRISKQLST